MATIPCSIPEFNAAFCEFHETIGFKNNTQEGISNMFKGLVLHYFGIENATEEEIEKCAGLIEIAASGAIRRGWDLVVPDLSKDNTN